MTLVAGAGFVGLALADELASSGERVVALTRSPGTAIRVGEARAYPVVAADVGDPAALAEVAGRLSRTRGGPGHPDVVVHCASTAGGGEGDYRHVFVGGCRNLVATFPGAVLVLTSSTSVYPQTDGAWVDERSPADPPSRTGRALREAEEIVLAGGGTVARLAGLYGPGRCVILKRFLEGLATIDGDPADPSAAGRTLNQLHRDDAVSALRQLLRNRAGCRASPAIFNVCDDTPMRQRECYLGLSTRLHRPLPPVVPPDLNRRRGWTDKRVSNRALRDTGWRPRYRSLLEAIDLDPDLLPSITSQVATGQGPAA
jgi:nucleoside-diphosphate-sugar epimerase